jgi:hypothetical protein
MSFGYLVKMENAPYLDPKRSGFNLFDKGLKRVCMKSSAAPE